MKRRREGTLEELQADTAEDLEKLARGGICGPADFMDRAEQLIEFLSPSRVHSDGRRVRLAPRSVRARRARELESYIAALRRAPANLEGWTNPAICAALIYGELAAELLADAPSKQRGLTRTEYLRHKDAGGVDKDFGERFKISPQGLTDWKREQGLTTPRRKP